MTTDRCRSLTGAHRFEPRFDEEPSPHQFRSKNYAMSPEEIRSLMVVRRYVGDVCRNCGAYRHRGDGVWGDAE